MGDFPVATRVTTLQIATMPIRWTGLCGENGVMVIRDEVDGNPLAIAFETSVGWGWFWIDPARPVLRASSLKDVIEAAAESARKASA